MAALSMAGRTLLAAATLLLLFSMGGGAIFGSPILLSVLFLVASRSGRAGRAVFGTLAGLVAAEVTWALVLTLEGESTAAIWLFPFTTLVVVSVICIRMGRGVAAL